MMSIEMLGNRAQMLQTEIQRAKQNVMGLTEQLEQAKIHLHTVSGHLNEVGYLLGEEQKAKQAMEESQKEQLNEAEHQEPEQAAEV